MSRTDPDERQTLPKASGRSCETLIPERKGAARSTERPKSREETPKEGNDTIAGVVANK